MTPRMHITWAVLESAKDAGDEMVVAARRRIIVAEHVGWRRHGNLADLRLVYSFADAMNDPGQRLEVHQSEAAQ